MTWSLLQQINAQLPARYDVARPLNRDGRECGSHHA
jgi:hypothetical protein